MSDRSALRIVVLRVLVVSILLTLLGRLGYLQVAEGDHYRKAASSNRVRQIITPAARGQILDDRGVALVSNRTALVVSVNRSIVRSQKHQGAEVLDRLAQVVGIPAQQIKLLITPCGEKDKSGVRAKAPNCWNGSPLQPVPIKSYRSDDSAQIRPVL
ncbi:MAG: Peptidoglycan glycosyltransferase, partial [Frankiales bacterium]|nr:Peptidoglycan glycosyltransferase [Frankiales bacterium]